MAELVSDRDQLYASGKRDLDFLLQNIPESVVSRARLLDVGCGIGRLTALAKERVTSVAAADISDAALTYAKDVVGPSSAVSYHTLNGSDLGGIEGPFEIIISFATLCHLPAPALLAYLRDFYHLVTPDGFVIIQMYVGSEHQFSETDSFSIRSYERGKLLRCLSEIGFSVQEVRDLLLPFDGRDHVFNRHPIVITLARSQQPPRVVTPDQLLLSPSHTQLQSKSPSDEEGLVLREVNAYLAQHNLLAAQKLLKYWVSVNPNCQYELIDTLRMIDESLNES
jgi:SAM-dependent methyltransferase